MSAFMFRYEPCESDPKAVRDLLDETGLFREGELDVAAELVDDRLLRGAASDYRFVFAGEDGELVGYVCYGHITVTVNRYDLYWIAVRKSMQGRGTGSVLLRETESRIKSEGGSIVYVETSSRQDYLPTLNFYLKNAYRQVCRVPDFYDEKDDKIILEKRLS